MTLPIIAAIIAVVLLIGYGAWSRRKIYNEIDILEGLKIQIMNRPLTDEIAKVKGLVMIGATEEKFESWRGEWDEMVTATLPGLEEDLFDAEEYADKYRFGKAREIIRQARRTIDSVSSRIEIITGEINELITSEELNREQIIEAKEQFLQAKKYYLTHLRSLGQTASVFDKEFEDIQHKFDEFEQLTSAGSHLEARQILVESANRLHVTKTKMQAVPELLVSVQSDLPSQLRNLREGFHEMEQQGYVLNHIVIEKEIEQLTQDLAEVTEKVYRIETEDSQKELDEMFSKVDQLYELLENEVVSKQFVLKEKEIIAEILNDMRIGMENLREETDIVSLTYQIDHNESEMQKKIEKLYNKLQNRFNLIEESIVTKKDSFSVIREMIEEMKSQLDELQRSQKIYQEMLLNLRKDELHTKEKLKELRRKLLEARRMVQKSNLPGLPEHYLVTIGKAEEYIIEVSKKLDEKPLEIAEVSYVLEKALEAVEEGYDETAKMIETAQLAEQLIQYGNRFRSSYQNVSIRLIEAEIAFRNCQYEDALQIAGSAVESVHPGVLKQMEINMKVHV
ncbi:septation ring formation regulator EzrA [Fictibacillus aquaticus]|uniref:Septation ring formation regulator EzrA n=1 Tax=Fictibacillus aquaticus TaxID=2021314 RepID=A0A235FBR1_9BACL|nr:septation ring formation regulator EzrA [Fictibacillus aquaticus]OYD58215.1 septation ring formation regulator EzrA [Fictibacillus aquaticus]